MNRVICSMKYAILGFITALALTAVSCYGGRIINEYAEPKIPPYAGPRFRKWERGIEV